MSSESDGDVVDYVSDHGQHEEGTLFLPCPEAGPDRWSMFFIGILAGVTGGALVPVSAWLSGAFICGGYGLAAFTLRNSCGRFGRAIRFGFVIAAMLGAALLVGEILSPEAIRRAMSLAGNRPVVFPGFALMPWVFGLLRYAYVLVR